MSYCRIEKEKSDVYMFESTKGGIECCMCSLNITINFSKRSEAIGHLELHIERGDKVPDKVIPRLKQEIKKHGDDV